MLERKGGRGGGVLYILFYSGEKKEREKKKRGRKPNQDTFLFPDEPKPDIGRWEGEGRE